MAKWGMLNKMGYEGWWVANVTESETVRVPAVAAERTTAVTQVTEMVNPTSEVQNLFKLDREGDFLTTFSRVSASFFLTLPLLCGFDLSSPSARDSS